MVSGSSPDGPSWVATDRQPMIETGEMRVGHTDLEMYGDEWVCEHINIANGNYTEEPCEYIEKVQIECKECGEVYQITILVN